MSDITLKNFAKAENINSTDDLCEKFFEDGMEDFKGLGAFFDTLRNDIIIATVLILIYVVCRYLSFRYEYNPFERNALKFIYGNPDLEGLHRFHRMPKNHPREYEHWVMNSNFAGRDEWSPEERERLRRHRRNIEKNMSGVFYLAFWKITLDDVLEHVGRDAYHYLRFQQYLFLTMLVLGLVLCLTILPINFSINFNSPLNSAFQKSLFNQNVQKHELFWVHIIVAFFVTGVMSIMNIFMLKGKTAPTRKNRNVVLLQDVVARKRPEFERLIKARFPKLQLARTFATFDYSPLAEDFQTFRELIQVIWNLESVIQVGDRNNLLGSIEAENRIRVYSPGDERSVRYLTHGEALEEYKKQLKIVTSELFSKVLLARQKPSHSMILKFAQDSEAFEFVNTVTNQGVITNVEELDALLELSALTRKGQDWRVQYTPDPLNINWRQITRDWKSSRTWNYVFFWLACIALVILTLPLMMIPQIMDVVTKVVNTTLQEDKNSTLMSIFDEEGADYIKNLLTGVLPMPIVALSYMIPTNLISERHTNIMSFSTYFLTFMILICQTLGLYSLVAGAEEPIQRDIRLVCLFNNDLATSFLHFQIHSIAFNFLSLSRISPLVSYFYNCYQFTWNGYEYSRARNKSHFRYDYPVHTSWCLLMMAISFTYCICCPYMLLAGAFYMLTKHINDRINIYMFFETSDLLTGKMHEKVIDLCHYPVLFMWLQLFCSVFSAPGRDFSNSKTLVVLLGTILYAIYMFFLRKPLMKRFTFNNKQNP